MVRTLVRSLFALVVILVANQRSYGQCGEILEHGIFNITATDTLETKTKILINWLSQTTLDSQEKAVNTGAALGVPIQGVPFQANGHMDAQEWRNYQAHLQSLNLSDEATLNAFKQVVITADQGIVNAWSKCTTEGKGVPHAVVEVNYDPKKFLVHLTYSPNGRPYSAVIDDFSIRPETVHCEPAIYTYWFWHSEIGSQGKILNCSRQSATDDIQLSGNTEKGPLKARLAGFVPPSKEPPKPAAVSTECRKGSFPPDAIDAGYNIGDQHVWYIKCDVNGTVTEAYWKSCVYTNGTACSHINPRPEKTGPCGKDNKSACIWFQTNDGNYKVITGTYTYIPDALPPK